MIEIVIPGPPMGKERVRFNRATGAAYSQERTITYEAKVAQAAMNLKLETPISGPIEADLIAYVAIPVSKSKKWKAQALAGVIRPTGKPDADNFVKAVLDGCNMILWFDDAQVVDIRVRKFYAEQARAVLRITNHEAPGAFA